MPSQKTKNLMIRIGTSTLFTGSMIVALIVGLACISPSVGQPEVAWNKTFGGPGNDTGFSVQETMDGGYVIVGACEGSRGMDTWLIKTDGDGNKEWKKTFGGSGDDVGLSVQETRDGGYIITGYTDSFGVGAGAKDAWLIRTDTNGIMKWLKLFGGPEDDLGTYVMETSDGPYIIAGSTNHNVWLIKTDSDGKEIWNKSVENYYKLADDLSVSVQETSDNDYVIIGDTSKGVELTKIDAAGNITWWELLGGSEESGGLLQETIDGGYAIARNKLRTRKLPTGYVICRGPLAASLYKALGIGCTKEYVVDYYGSEVLLTKIDTNGNELWERNFSKSSYNTVSALQCTEDAGYIIAVTNNDDVWLIKTDSAGNETWEMTISGPKPEEATSVLETRDGGYVITGWTESYGSGGSDIWLAKVK